MPSPDEITYYNTVDLPVYYNELEEYLPETVLDFHTHVWLKEHFRVVPWAGGVPGGSYMIVAMDYGFEALQADGKRFFPTRKYEAVCFGYPAPTGNIEASNAYVSHGGGHPGLYPLMVQRNDSTPSETIREQLQAGAFFGYKVATPWQGDDYGDVTVEDMLGEAAMEVANEQQLVVLLHLPRSGRMADPVNIKGLQRLSKDYPQAQIVLAHCGRCYCPGLMQKGIGALKDLENLYFDVSMVQDPVVLQILFDHVPSARVFYATDLPVAAMRGRRVCVNDHWVDVVREPSQGSAFRISSESLNATFMAYEIARAVRDAALLVGLSRQELRSIFYDNGMALLSRVAQGKTLQSARKQAQP
jgi:predicted TIM-barrel fold metal-dependent hydrolase